MVGAEQGPHFDLQVMEWPYAQAQWLLTQACWSDRVGVWYEPGTGLVARSVPGPKRVATSVAFIAGDGAILDIVDVGVNSQRELAHPDRTRYLLQVRQGLFAAHTVRLGDRVFARAGGPGGEIVPLMQMPKGG